MTETATIKGVTFKKGDLALGFKNTDGSLTYGEVTNITDIKWQDVAIKGIWVDNESVRKLVKLSNKSQLSKGDKVFIVGEYEELGCNDIYTVAFDEDDDIILKDETEQKSEYLAAYELLTYEMYKVIQPVEDQEKQKEETTIIIHGMRFYKVDSIELNGTTIKVGDFVIGKDSLSNHEYRLGKVTHITDPKRHCMNVRINNELWLCDSSVHKVEHMEKRSQLPFKCKLFIDGMIDGGGLIDTDTILDYEDHYITSTRDESNEGLYVATYDFTEADIYLVHMKPETTDLVLDLNDTVVNVESPYERLGKAIIEKERLSNLIDSKQDAIDKLMKERNTRIDEHNNILHKINEIKSEIKGDVTNG